MQATSRQATAQTVLFSSIASLTGPAGSSNYAAVNALLDAAADELQMQGAGMQPILISQDVSSQGYLSFCFGFERAIKCWTLRNYLACIRSPPGSQSIAIFPGVQHLRWALSLE